MSSTEAAARRARAATSSSRPKRPALIGDPETRRKVGCTRSRLPAVAGILRRRGPSAGTPRRTSRWRASLRSGRHARRPPRRSVSTRTPWACALSSRSVAGLQHCGVGEPSSSSTSTGRRSGCHRPRTGPRRRRPGLVAARTGSSCSASAARAVRPVARRSDSAILRPARAASTVPPHMMGLDRRCRWRGSWPGSPRCRGAARSRRRPRRAPSAITFGSVSGPRWTRSSRSSTTTATASWSPVWVGSSVA